MERRGSIALERGRAAIASQATSEQARLALRLVETVLHYARAQYAEAVDLLRPVSAEQRVGVGGSRVERVLIDLLEARAVALAA